VSDEQLCAVAAVPLLAPAAALAPCSPALPSPPLVATPLVASAALVALVMPRTRALIGGRPISVTQQAAGITVPAACCRERK